MRISKLALASALGCAIALFPAGAFAQQLKLDQLNPLAGRAKENVEVALDSQMLQMAGGFLSSRKDATPEAKQKVMDIVAGLKAVYVRNYEFDKEGLYSEQDVNSVRTQLKAPWSRIVNVQNAADKETVEVYVWPDGAVSGGLTVLVANPKELTVVNIVGRIDIGMISTLAGQLGIPKNLGIPGVTPPQAPPVK